MIEKKVALFALATLCIAAPVLSDVGCDYKGSSYSHGSAVCQVGNQYRCNSGKWAGLGLACTDNLPLGAKGCAFNGNAYSAGSASCQAGTQYRCDDGTWMSLALACTASGQIAARMPVAERTCMYNGATVATESTICKSGVTFRCDDGEWRNLGSACQ
jgi:hypothetical protein